MHTEDLHGVRRLLGRHQVLITLLVHLPVPEGAFQLRDLLKADPKHFMLSVHTIGLSLVPAPRIFSIP